MTEAVPLADLQRSQHGLCKVETYSDWLAFGKKLSNADRFLQFRIGDWLNFGHGRYERGKYEEGLRLFPQYEWEALRKFAWGECANLSWKLKRLQTL